jgi:hypothetical protein
MKNNYTNYLPTILIGLLMLTTGLASAQNTITVSGAGSSGANGTYTYAGISNSNPYYTKGSYTIEYRSFPGWGTVWGIFTNSSSPLYVNWNSSTTPVMTSSSWFDDYGMWPLPTVSNEVTFTNGSAYTAPGATPGTNNNSIGRFFLDPGAEGNMTAATVQFGGSPTGVTAVKLWSSADAVFNSASDLQLGSSKSYASSVTFDGFTSTMNIDGTYYFITADLNSSPTGSISASITNASAFTLTLGSVTTSFSSASLSSGFVPLPVQLLSFTAQSKQDAVTLHWTTDREENFAGFEPERSVDGNSWTKMSFVASKANNVSSTTQYSYTDNNPVAGHTFYRLKMVDANGSFTYSKQLTIVKNGQNASLQNYPNPFKKQTFIAFQLPVNSLATLKVYNNMGVEVSTLINKQLDAGSYTISFDGASLPVGVYHYTLRYGKEKISGTMLLQQ